VIGAKAMFDPGTCQAQRFAPLPAVLLVRHFCAGLEGLLAKLSRTKTLHFCFSQCLS
jgi:hypothetical protein